MLTKDQITAMPKINTEIEKAKCTKVDYGSKKAALEDIKLIYIQRKFHSKKYSGDRKSNQKMSPYSCKRCGGWHITCNVNYRKSKRRENK